MPYDMKAVISSMWDQDPEKRPSAADVVKELERVKKTTYLFRGETKEEGDDENKEEEEPIRASMTVNPILAMMERSSAKLTPVQVKKTEDIIENKENLKNDTTIEEVAVSVSQNEPAPEPKSEEINSDNSDKV